MNYTLHFIAIQRARIQAGHCALRIQTAPALTAPDCWTVSPADQNHISIVPLTARELSRFWPGISQKYACHLFALFPPHSCLQFWAKVETKLCEPCAVGFGFHIKTRLNSIRVNYLTTLVLPPLHSNPRQLCSPRSLYFTFYSSISDSTCGFYGYCFWTLGLMEQNLNTFLFTCTFHLMKFSFSPVFPSNCQLLFMANF